jgi:hypothetical protein
LSATGTVNAARCLGAGRHLWVKMRKARHEDMWSGLAQRSDLTADLLNWQHRATGDITEGTESANLSGLLSRHHLVLGPEHRIKLSQLVDSA